MTGMPFHPVAYALQGLITLSNEIERELARVLGVNLTDYRALSTLAALSGSEPVTVGKLAGQLGATSATTTAIVNRLESRGYVQRERGDDDRRHVRVRVTPAAYQRIMHLMEPLTTGTNEYVWSLPPHEQRVVEDFFGVAQRHMRDQLATLSSLEVL